MRRLGEEVFNFNFAKQIAEKVKELAKEKDYKPWDIRRLTLADIRRLYGPLNMPSRKKKNGW